MGILAINVNTTGLVGSSVAPSRCTLTTTDNLATITAAGYLNRQNLLGNTVSPQDVFDVLYSFNTSTGVGTYGIFIVSISNGVISLSSWANPGDVLLPVVSGDFAVFNGTSGQIKDAGYLPSDATKTNVAMASGSITANHIAQFADTAGTIKDGGVLGTAAAKAASDNTKATLASVSASTVAGNVVTAADTAGTIQDGGTALSALQLKANIKAAVTGNIGGSGAGPINVSVSGMTTSSVVVATIASSSNTVSVAKAVAGTGQFAITFSGDPGATCTVNYVAFIAAQ